MFTQEAEDLELAELEAATRPEAQSEDPEILDAENSHGQEDKIEESQELDPALVEETPAPTVQEPTTNDQLLAAMKLLQEQIIKLRKAPKNQVAGTPGNKTYARKGNLNTEGKIPQQQADLSKILVNNMAVGEKFTEAQVFAFLQKDYSDYPSLLNSKQDVTYLFKYYRGLKRDGKHAGFVARDFLTVS